MTDTPDTSQLLANKENYLNLAEENQGLVEDFISDKQKKAIDLNILITEKRLEIKKLEQEIEENMPSLRMAKRNCQRLRREYYALKREYFKRG